MATDQSSTDYHFLITFSMSSINMQLYSLTQYILTTYQATPWLIPPLPTFYRNRRHHYISTKDSLALGHEPTPHASRKMIISKDLLKLNQIPSGARNKKKTLAFLTTTKQLICSIWTWDMHSSSWWKYRQDSAFL